MVTQCQCDLCPPKAAVFRAASPERSAPSPDPAPAVSAAPQGEAGGPAADQAPPAGCEYTPQMSPFSPPGQEAQFSSAQFSSVPG